MTTQGGSGGAPARRNVGRGLVYAGTIMFFIGLFIAAMLPAYGPTVLILAGLLFAVGIAMRVGTTGTD
jgi:Na+-translocating ferredoxin:NAD+ oxidoreductase RnfD subunit